jgi:hypothetical protein
MDPFTEAQTTYFRDYNEYKQLMEQRRAQEMLRRRQAGASSREGMQQLHQLFQRMRGAPMMPPAQPMHRMGVQGGMPTLPSLEQYMRSPTPMGITGKRG